MTEPRAYPPFHLGINASELEALGRGLHSYAPVRDDYSPDEAGPRADMVWLKSGDGTVCL
jgi:hypothetical protein